MQKFRQKLLSVKNVQEFNYTIYRYIWDDMQKGDILDITELLGEYPKAKQKFIECVIDFIQSDLFNKFTVDINSQQTKIRKF